MFSKFFAKKVHFKVIFFKFDEMWLNERGRILVDFFVTLQLKTKRHEPL